MNHDLASSSQVVNRSSLGVPFSIPLGYHRNLIIITSSYDNKSNEGSNWVRQGDESESGKIVLNKWNGPFLMHIYDKQCGIMQKKSMEGSKLSDSVFLQWDVRSSVLKTPKKHQN